MSDAGMIAAVLGRERRENPDHGPCVQDPLTHSVIYHQDADGYLWGVKLSEVTMDRDGAAWFSAESCS